MPQPIEHQQMQEYTALNSGVGFVRLVQRTQVELTGRDRAKFLHNFCTNDISRLAAGQGCEAFITNVQGRILAFLHVANGSDAIRLETVSNQAERLIAHFDKYLIADDVEITDLSEQTAMFAVSGKNRADLLAGLLQVPMPGGPCDHIVAPFRSSKILIQSTRATCSGTLQVSVDRSLADEFAAALASAGATACSADVWDTCRIEAGFPEYGRDISEKNLPQEIGRNQFAISFTKGCYLGQETVARIDAIGHVNWHLVGVRCENTGVTNGDEFKSRDATVGSVTSVCFSPTLGAVLALGYVRREHAKVGTQLSCQDAAAEVIALPVAEG